MGLVHLVGQTAMQEVTMVEELEENQEVELQILD